jgi:heme/copper-type cytochrome/quinol oxidase subunit 3
MAPATTDRAPVPRPLPRRGITDNGLLGMGLFVFTEVMLFAAFISGYTIVRNAAPPGSWPPPGQPTLPFAQTLLQTGGLLASGVLLFVAHRAARARGIAAASTPLLAAIVLGLYFVVAQGLEWTALLRQGLTLTSSQVGAFFYTIVGAHALHAMAAIVALLWCWVLLRAGRLTRTVFGATQLFWYFVVLVWPFLFAVVYR